MKEFERLSKIKPWKNARFNLDRVSDIPKNLIHDRTVLGKISDCFNEFKRDGAAHTWSTFRIIDDDVNVPIINTTMNDERAAEIISHIGGKSTFF